MTSRPNVRSLFAFLVAVAVLAGALQLREIAAHWGYTLPRFPFPYGRSLVDNFLAVVVATLAALGLAKAHRWRLADNLGLRWNGWKSPALVALATVPCWIGLGWQGSLASDVGARDLLFLAVIFPLAEEIVFRGFGFIFARRQLGWPIALALIVQAALFGAIHWIGAGAAGAMALQVFLITFAGGLLFAVFDMQGGWTIWNGWVFHVSLNAAWTVFAVSGNAATGWTGNALRLGSAALALILLRVFRQRTKDAS